MHFFFLFKYHKMCSVKACLVRVVAVGEGIGLVILGDCYNHVLFGFGEDPED